MKYSLIPTVRPTGAGRYDLLVQVIYEHDEKKMSTTLTAGTGFTSTDQATNAFFAPEVMGRIMARARQLSPGATANTGVKPAGKVAPVHPVAAPAKPVMSSAHAEIYGNAPRLVPTRPPESAGRVVMKADGSTTLVYEKGNKAIETSSEPVPGDLPKTENGTIRVHEAAKNLGVPWQSLVNYLQRQGVTVSSHMAVIPVTSIAGLTADKVA